MGCYIWYSEEGTDRGPSPPRPLLAVPNVTAVPSTASVPTTVLLYYNGLLLCGLNVLTKDQSCVRSCGLENLVTPNYQIVLFDAKRLAPFCRAIDDKEGLSVGGLQFAGARTAQCVVAVDAVVDYCVHSV